MSDPSQISDGYHTFAELYAHRHALLIALMRAYPVLFWYSKRHNDGELCFGDGEWFIVGARLPLRDRVAQISYHLPISLWDKVSTTGATKLERGLEWDGHTPDDVVQALLEWATTAPHASFHNAK